MKDKPRKNAQSPLALMRKAKGLTQVEAAKLLGLKHKQNLCTVEIGVRHADQRLMKAMVVAYGVTPLEVLRSAVQTFENGTTMRKHRDRQVKVMMLERKAS